MGGIPELMDEHRGVLVPPRDAALLTGALQSVLRRTWNGDDIAARSHRGWEDAAQEVLDLLCTLVQTPQQHVSNASALRAVQR